MIVIKDIILIFILVVVKKPRKLVEMKMRWSQRLIWMRSGVLSMCSAHPAFNCGYPDARAGQDAKKGRPSILSMALI